MKECCGPDADPKYYSRNPTVALQTESPRSNYIITQRTYFTTSKNYETDAENNEKSPYESKFICMDVDV